MKGIALQYVPGTGTYALQEKALFLSNNAKSFSKVKDLAAECVGFCSLDKDGFAFITKSHNLLFNDMEIETEQKFVSLAYNGILFGLTEDKGVFIIGKDGKCTLLFDEVAGNKLGECVCLRVDREGHYFLATKTQVFRYDHATKNYRVLYEKTDQEISRISVDSFGRLFIANRAPKTFLIVSP